MFWNKILFNISNICELKIRNYTNFTVCKAIYLKKIKAILYSLVLKVVWYYIELVRVVFNLINKFWMPSLRAHNRKWLSLPTYILTHLTLDEYYICPYYGKRESWNIAKTSTLSTKSINKVFFFKFDRTDTPFNFIQHISGLCYHFED